MLMGMWHTQKRYPRGETFYTQCTAVAVAVHCGGGCSALQERLQCTASKTGSLWRSPTDFLKSLTHVRQSPFDWQKPAQGKTAVRDT